MDIKKIVLEAKNKDKLLLAAIAGIILIICSYSDVTKMESKNTPEVKTEKEQDIEDDTYVEKIESELKQLICQIDGAGKCSVMITLKSGSEKVLQNDKTKKSKTEKGDKEITESDESYNTLILQRDDEEYPYVVKEIMPKIEGVVVVAEGAGNKKVSSDIVKIVQALFDVEPHKISIIEMK